MQAEHGGSAALDVQADFCNVLCEFIEAAIHTTIHARQLYSPELFERCKIYNILFISKSRHPQLNQYISSVVAKLKVSDTRFMASHIVSAQKARCL